MNELFTRIENLIREAEEKKNHFSLVEMDSHCESGLYIDISDMLSQSLKAGASVMPISWMYQAISHISVDYMHDHVITVGDGTDGIGTGRGGLEKRFHHKIPLHDVAADGVEMDTGGVIEFADLVQLTNSVGEEAALAIIKQVVKDKYNHDNLRIGLNGTHIGGITEPQTYPNGEDVTLGWHQIAKEGGAQIISTAITVGQGGDYKNLDVLVADLIKTHIHPAFQNDPRLVVMVGHELAAAERLNLFNGVGSAADQQAANNHGSKVGGKFAFTPPYMPGSRLAITLLPNLCICTQKHSLRECVVVSDHAKEINFNVWRFQCYALKAVELYTGVDEGMITFI